VKELIENSIDANSTQICITFIECGKKGFEISDNGCGIRYSESSKVATKGGTSKLSDWEGLSVITFLFNSK